MIKFNMLDKRLTQDALGLIPEFLSEKDSDSAATQFNRNYIYGGWDPFKGFEHVGNHMLQYPGDPIMKPIAEAKLRDETIVIYPHAWVAVYQPDGSFEISRMD